METNKATFIVTSVSFVLVESILMARHSLSVSFNILSAVFKQSGQYKQTRNRRQKGVKECIRDSHRIATYTVRYFHVIFSTGDVTHARSHQSNAALVLPRSISTVLTMRVLLLLALLVAGASAFGM
jgi:hypothetical protein